MRRWSNSSPLRSWRNSCAGSLRLQRHGGLVNHAFGEEIVCLFGVPIGHEDDDLRAVRAAVELHARAREMNKGLANELSLPFQIQSGVHAGLLLARKLND